MRPTPIVSAYMQLHPAPFLQLNPPPPSSFPFHFLGASAGMIEIVPQCMTLASIVAASLAAPASAAASSSATAGGGAAPPATAVGGGGFLQQVRAALQVYAHDGVYREWLAGGAGCALSAAVEDAFVRSCAGAVVSSFVLGIGDRHNDNMLLCRDGRLLHIDFGHVLGHFKSKLGIRRERTPFVFTPALAAVMGGEGAPAYQRFEALAVRAFNVLRRHADTLLLLTRLMRASGLPQLADDGYMRERLMPALGDVAAAEELQRLIKAALGTRTTQFNDAVHLLAVPRG